MDIKIIIPQGRIKCQLIDSVLDKNCLVGYNHLMSNKREWNNCSIKNNQGILLDLIDFEKEVVVVHRGSYNYSY